MAKYTVINQETGESTELTDEDLSFGPKDTDVATIGSNDTAMDFLAGKIPYHIQRLIEKSERLHLSPEDAEYELGCFVGVPSQDFSDYINQKVTVLGAAIIPHGPYKAKEDKDNPNAPLHPGYLRCLFVIDETDKHDDYVVLECNGVNVFDHTLNMLTNYGWYMWEKPREYMIRRGGKSNAYHMKSVHKDNRNNVVVESTK